MLKSMEMLRRIALWSWLVAAFCTWVASGEIRLVENNQVVFKQVVQAYRFLGINENQGSAEVLKKKLRVMTKNDMDKFCNADADGQKRFRDNATAFLIMESFDITCNGKLGSWNDFRYFLSWCSLEGVILRGYETTAPGMFANGHDGSRFETLVAEAPELAFCKFYDVRLDTETAKSIVRMENYTANVTIQVDASQVLATYDSTICVIIFRILIPLGYLALFVTTLVVWKTIKQQGKLSFRMVLFLVTKLWSCAALGVANAYGIRYIGPMSFFFIGLTWQNMPGMALSGALLSGGLNSSPMYDEKTVMNNDSALRVHGAMIGAMMELATIFVLARMTGTVFQISLLSFQLTTAVFYIWSVLLTFNEAFWLRKQTMATAPLETSAGSPTRGQKSAMYLKKMIFIKYMSAWAGCMHCFLFMSQWVVSFQSDPELYLLYSFLLCLSVQVQGAAHLWFCQPRDGLSKAPVESIPTAVHRRKSLPDQDSGDDSS